LSEKPGYVSNPVCRSVDFYATNSGGFLFVVNLGLVSMKDSDIQHNKAKEVGGAIGGVNSYVYLTG